MIKKTKTLRFNPKLIKDLELLAEKENRNFNNLTETLLEKCVKFPDLVLSLK